MHSPCSYHNCSRGNDYSQTPVSKEYRYKIIMTLSWYTHLIFVIMIMWYGGTKKPEICDLPSQQQFVTMYIKHTHKHTKILVLSLNFAVLVLVR